MVFTRTKREAQKVCDELTERGFAVGTVHGDLGQGAREQALRAFRTGKVDVLVATDVAARGIDVDNVTHVVNYECPDDEKTYLHRIGRTGRAGHSGTAVTFVDWEDVARWQMIDRALKLPFKDPIETYSTSDHVYTGLNIPAGTGGTLPKASRTREGLVRREGRGPRRDRQEEARRPRSKRHAATRRQPQGSQQATAGGRAQGSREAARREALRRPRTEQPKTGHAEAAARRTREDRSAHRRQASPAPRQRRRTKGGDADRVGLAARARWLGGHASVTSAGQDR